MILLAIGSASALSHAATRSAHKARLRAKGTSTRRLTRRRVLPPYRLTFKVLKKNAKGTGYEGVANCSVRVNIEYSPNPAPEVKTDALGRASVLVNETNVVTTISFRGPNSTSSDPIFGYDFVEQSGIHANGRYVIILLPMQDAQR